MSIHPQAVRTATLSCALTLFSLASAGATAQTAGDASAAASAAKQAAVQSVDKHAADLTKLSDQVWAFAETALREHKSSKVLADYAQKQGFKVERGVSQMPTAFVATYGSGRPIIGIMGEYDALPGISQKASSVKEPLVEGAAGHGCGHNLFGAASLGAALAIKEQIQSGKLKGTIKFFGTPAEEDIGGKVYMARDGLFNDVDVMFAWHPGDKNQADTTSSQAMVSLYVEFYGKAAHAAADPWNGRSAVDALEIFTHGVNMMREHIKPSSRMHYVIMKGGDVPNVVPEYGKVWLWLRDWKRTEVESLLARARKLAEGAAIMTETKSKITVLGGSWEILVNTEGERLLDRNLRWLGPINYTEDELNFARTIQKATNVPAEGMDTSFKAVDGQEVEGGSTDVGDVSWVVPTLHVTIATSPKAAPWHAWPVVATSGMSIGHKGLVQASKTLAASMVDLYEQPALIEQIQAEFKEKKGNVVFDPYIPDGPPPVPKD